jgi:hypothetical protein
MSYRINRLQASQFLQKVLSDIAPFSIIFFSQNFITALVVDLRVLEKVFLGHAVFILLSLIKNIVILLDLLTVQRYLIQRSRMYSQE